MLDKIRKMKDQAADLLRKGKYEKALKLYKEVVQHDPSDYSCHNNVGYILLKLNRQAEAIEVFEDLANSYIQKGFLLKAIATCKVILEIDPDHKRVQEELAALYAKRSEQQQPVPVKVMTEEGEAQVGGEAVVPIAPVLEAQAPDPAAQGEFAVVLPTPVEVLQDVPTSESQEGVQESPDVDFEVDVVLDSTRKQEKSLPEIPLFSDLAQDAFVALLENMKLIKAKVLK